MSNNSAVRCESAHAKRNVLLQTNAVTFQYRWIVETFSGIFRQQPHESNDDEPHQQQDDFGNIGDDDGDDVAQEVGEEEAEAEAEEEEEEEEEDEVGDDYIDDEPESCQHPHVDSPLFAADVSRGINWYLRLVAPATQRGQRNYSLYLHLDRSSSWSGAMAVFAANVGYTFLGSCCSIAVLYNPGKYSTDGSVKYEPYRIANFIDELILEEASQLDRLVISVEVVQLPMTTYAESVNLPPSNGLSGKFVELLQQEKLVDVTFKTDDGRCFPAHRFILAARSPVFQAMFDSQWTEASKPTVAVPEVDSDVFAEVLSFMYSDVAPPSLPNKPLELLVVADRFALPRLIAMAENQLIEQLSDDDVCDVLMRADQHCRPYLKQAALKYLTQNAETVSRTEGWNRLHDARDLLDEVILKACRQADVEGPPPAKRFKTN